VVRFKLPGVGLALGRLWDRVDDGLALGRLWVQVGRHFGLGWGLAAIGDALDVEAVSCLLM
jgi:hypothetical protein